MLLRSRRTHIACGGGDTRGDTGGAIGSTSADDAVCLGRASCPEIWSGTIPGPPKIYHVENPERGKLVCGRSTNGRLTGLMERRWPRVLYVHMSAPSRACSERWLYGSSYTRLLDVER